MSNRVFFLIFLITILIGSSVYAETIFQGETFGYGRTEKLPINFSEIPTVNSTDNWITNLGLLTDVNSAQFDNIGNTLTIDESHIEIIGNAWWLRRDGSNSPTDNINWGGFDITNLRNITGLNFLGGDGFFDNIYDRDEVDDLVGGATLELFLKNTSSGISNYLQMNRTANGFPKNASIITLSTTETFLGAFISPNVSDLGLSGLDEGIIEGHFHAKVDATVGKKSVEGWFKIYKRTSGGSETFLASSHVILVDSTDESEYEAHATLVDETNFDEGDRIVLKMYANLSGSGGNPTLTTYISGDTLARATLGTVGVNFATARDLLGLLPLDGSRAMTSNLDMGTKNLINISSIISTDAGSSIDYSIGAWSIKSNNLILAGFDGGGGAGDSTIILGESGGNTLTISENLATSTFNHEVIIGGNLDMGGFNLGDIGLIQGDSGNTIIDIPNTALVDLLGDLSMDWTSRILYATDGSDPILNYDTVGLAQFGNSNIITTGTIFTDTIIGPDAATTTIEIGQVNGAIAMTAFGSSLLTLDLFGGFANFGPNTIITSGNLEVDTVNSDLINSLLYTRIVSLATTQNVFERTTTGTSGVVGGGLFKCTSSGNMVDGFGCQNLYQVKDTGGAFVQGAIGFFRDGADNTGKGFLAYYQAGAQKRIIQYGTDGVFIDDKLNVSDSIEYNGTLITHSPFIVCGSEEGICIGFDFTTKVWDTCERDGKGLWACNNNNIKILQKLKNVDVREALRKEYIALDKNCNENDIYVSFSEYQKGDSGCSYNRNKALENCFAEPWNYWDKDEDGCFIDPQLVCLYDKTTFWVNGKCEVSEEMSCNVQEDMIWDGSSCVFSQYEKDKRITFECYNDRTQKVSDCLISKNFIGRQL